MILIAAILWLLAGGLLAWLVGQWSKTWPRWIAIIFLAVHLGVLLGVGIPALVQAAAAGNSWAIEVQRPWIPQLGFGLHLAMDGFSFLLLVLTDFLGLIAVGASWTGIEERVGFFHLNLMFVLGALVGLFLALDLILFYFFWELSLVPLYFLIGVWGHENRIYATIKFFIFTQASGLFMLLAIIGLYLVHGHATGTFTFDYLQLLGTSMPLSISFWLMLGFFAAFAVKLSIVPVHSWLPDAHTQAPTAGSVVLAGLLLKAGAYGMIRFMVPLFPEAAKSFTVVGMALGATSVIYGAIIAFGQTDLKRLVAYTSISHMGFILLGIFAWNQIALQGAVIIILAHGVTTGSLFVLVGYIQDRLGTRDMRKMGGLWTIAPLMGGAAMVLAIASMGVPGLANFVGEFLVLAGAYLVNRPLIIIATTGFIVATIYALWIIQRAFWGPGREGLKFPDLAPREVVVLVSAILVIAWLGLYPQPALNAAQLALETMQNYAAQVQQIDGGAP